MVATARRDASEVGVSILQQGGNAIDAAVAVGYALAVTEPCCGNIGGGGFMMIRYSNDPHNGKHKGQEVFINFREKAPSQLTGSAFTKSNGAIDTDALYFGYSPIGIPGTVLGLEVARSHYGTLKRSELIQPAVQLAYDGFVVSRFQETIFQKALPYFKQHDNVAKIFLKKDGNPYRAGDILQQEQLADTLRTIAKMGSKAFYEGSIANELASSVQKAGGVLNRFDLKNYTIKIASPMHCQYRGYDLMLAPLPSSGGVSICQTLHLLHAYPLSHYHFNATQSTHYMIEAMRHAFADRNQYLADPVFHDIPINWLLSNQHINQLRSQIKPYAAGHYESVCTRALTQEHQNTTHYSIVDKWGNAVAVTYTLDAFFGAKVMPGKLGFFLNNQIHDFEILPGKPNSLEPGKQPLSSMSPTIITKNGTLAYVIGTPGGPTIITTIVQTLVNLFDYHMTLQEAIDKPRFHAQCFPDTVFMEPGRFSWIKQVILGIMGHHLTQGSIYKTTRWGAVAMIAVDPKTGNLTGAIDSRRPAGAALGVYTQNTSKC